MEFKITEETIMNAEHYVPLAEKKAFVEEVATKCFDTLNMSAGDTALPPMYKENTAVKARFLLGAFLKMYFDVEFEPVENEIWLLSQDDYDRYAENHIFNQLERHKSNALLRDKVFDILGDYKQLEKMLNTEIYSMLQAMNDVLGRAFLHIGTMITPEAMQDTLTQLASVKEEIEQYTSSIGQSAAKEE